MGLLEWAEKWHPGKVRYGSVLGIFSGLADLVVILFLIVSGFWGLCKRVSGCIIINTRLIKRNPRQKGIRFNCVFSLFFCIRISLKFYSGEITTISIKKSFFLVWFIMWIWVNYLREMSVPDFMFILHCILYIFCYLLLFRTFRFCEIFSFAERQASLAFRVRGFFRDLVGLGCVMMGQTRTMTKML